MTVGIPNFSERRMQTPCHRRCTIPIPAVSRSPGLTGCRDGHAPRDAGIEKVSPDAGREAGLGWRR
jgi:hypothetical protein